MVSAAFAVLVGGCWNAGNLACLWVIARRLAAPRPRPWMTGGLIVLKMLLLVGGGWLIMSRAAFPAGWLTLGISVPFVWLILRTVQRSVVDDGARRTRHS